MIYYYYYYYVERYFAIYLRFSWKIFHSIVAVAVCSVQYSAVMLEASSIFIFCFYIRLFATFCCSYESFCFRLFCRKTFVRVCMYNTVCICMYNTLCICMYNTVCICMYNTVCICMYNTVCICMYNTVCVLTVAVWKTSLLHSAVLLKDINYSVSCSGKYSVIR